MVVLFFFLVFFGLFLLAVCLSAFLCAVALSSAESVTVRLLKPAHIVSSRNMTLQAEEQQADKLASTHS
jgi:hypothetical protein